MSTILYSNSSTTSAGWAVLRAVVGLIFVMHGWQKVSETTIAGTQAGFARMGVPLAELAAPFVATVETVGGALLMVGLLTRIVAALQAAIVLGALVLVHLPNGFFSSDGGIEFTLLLTVSAVFFVLAGPGPWSADRAIASRRTGSRAVA